MLVGLPVIHCLAAMRGWWFSFTIRLCIQTRLAVNLDCDCILWDRHAGADGGGACTGGLRAGQRRGSDQ